MFNPSKLILTLIIVSAVLIPAASANMTHIVPPADTVIVNQTTIFSTSPHTPIIFFGIMLTLALILLAGSRILSPEQGNDICGYVAPIPWLFSTIMSLGIDVKTSSGVVASVETVSTITIIENHTIYQEWLLFIFLAIMTVISVANIIVIHNARKEAKLEENKTKGYQGEY